VGATSGRTRLGENRQDATGNYTGRRESVSDIASWDCWMISKYNLLHRLARLQFTQIADFNSKSVPRFEKQHLRDYVNVLLDTGARPGAELLNLRWNQVETTSAPARRAALMTTTNVNYWMAKDRR